MQMTRETKMWQIIRRESEECWHSNIYFEHSTNRTCRTITIARTRLNDWGKESLMGLYQARLHRAVSSKKSFEENE
jgi:hypothetical protein